MHSVIEKRSAAVKELGAFIKSAKESLRDFTLKLGWDFRELLKGEVQERVVVCPFNPGHQMPESSLPKHVESCAWIHEGYSKEERDSALPSSHFFYTNSTSVVPVLIDKKAQANVLKTAANHTDSGIFLPSEDKNVPRTMDRAMTELTPQERLAIYEYVIAKAKETNKQSMVKIEDLQISFEKKNEQNQREKTHLEILAEQRDYKRRRQSYRAKNVHITKKSYTEVMREVIQNQMDILQDIKNEDYNEERLEIKKEHDETPSESNRKHQRHSMRRSPTPERDYRSEYRKHRDHRSSRNKHDRYSSGSSSKDRHGHKHKHHKHKKSRRKSSSSDES